MSTKINLGKGWVPSQFLIRQGRGYVEMVNFKGGKLVETFMRFDLQNCRQRSLISFDALEDYCAPSRDLSASVSGMIFHMSRCGSTLATQMLRHSSKHVVIAEPDVLGQFLQNFRGSPEFLINSLRNLIALLADTLCKPDQKLIIKWSSWNIYLIDSICQAVPEVPMCYQYRSPNEVLVSLARNRAEWMDLKRIRKTHQRRGYFGENGDLNPYIDLLESSGGEEAPFEELGARIIGKCCERALKYSSQLLMVSYAEMPGALFTHIAPHFSVEMNSVERSRARIESKWDTKAIGGAKQFESDVSIKKQMSTDETDAYVQTYIQPHLSKLLAAATKEFAPKVQPYSNNSNELRASTAPEKNKLSKTAGQDDNNNKDIAPNRIPVEWF